MDSSQSDSIIFTLVTGNFLLHHSFPIQYVFSCGSVENCTKYYSICISTHYALDL